MDIEKFAQNYDIRDPELNEHMWEVADHLLERCPVGRGTSFDVTGTGNGTTWVLSRYDDIYGVLQDWRTFSNNGLGETPEGGFSFSMPPITVDPPIQRDFRHLLNPYLSPQSVAPYEPGIRKVMDTLIDAFIGDGHCDLVTQVARPFPAKVFFPLLWGIDDDEDIERCMGWVHKMDYEPDAPDIMDVRIAWFQWCQALMERRRTERRDDMVDALIFGTVGGRPLTDEEIAGAIQILILGGFSTTADALGSIMMLLLERPDILARLRDDPSVIPATVDEGLRLEPPVVNLPRTCRQDVEVAGEKISRGDSVLMHFFAANHDPREFEEPARFDPDRARNRHMTFGGGVHRCIGSNLARLNLRVALEQILSRLQDVRITPGDTPRRTPPTISRGWAYIPLTFTPA